MNLTATENGNLACIKFVQDRIEWKNSVMIEVNFMYTDLFRQINNFSRTARNDSQAWQVKILCSMTLTSMFLQNSIKKHL
jgi:hypothetical protein